MRAPTGKPPTAGDVIADALEVVAGVPNAAYAPRATLWAARRIALCAGPEAVECLRAVAERAGLKPADFDDLARLGCEYAARSVPSPRPVTTGQLADRMAA